MNPKPPSGALLCVLAAAGLPAQAAKNGTDTESFATIQAAYQKDYSAWMQKYRAIIKQDATKEERTAVMHARPTPESFAPRAQRIIDRNPAGSESLKATVWMVNYVRPRGDRLGRLLHTLEKHHLKSEEIKDVLGSLVHNPEPHTNRFLRLVTQKTKHVEVQAIASYHLAEHCLNNAKLHRQISAGDAEGTVRLTKLFGRESVDLLKSMEPEKLEAEALGIFQRIVASDEFQAVKRYGQPLGTLARGAMFELQNLSVGKVAPEIAGEDLDGNQMKLSDYRGKVVVLDFWGDW